MDCPSEISIVVLPVPGSVSKKKIYPEVSQYVEWGLLFNRALGPVPVKNKLIRHSAFSGGLSVSYSALPEHAVVFPLGDAVNRCRINSYPPGSPAPGTGTFGGSYDFSKGDHFEILVPKISFSAANSAIGNIARYSHGPDGESACIRSQEFVRQWLELGISAGLFVNPSEIRRGISSAAVCVRQLRGLCESCNKG